MRLLRVAAGQEASVAGELAVNVATAARLATSAADRGARVLVLPELFLTGYAPETWAHEASIALDDPDLAPLVELATERDLVVLAGAAVRRALDASTLSLLAFTPDGEVHVAYDKQHLTGPERDFFTRGDRGGSLVVDGWDLGLGICYDARFPGHAGAAVEAGAAAYLVSMAYYVGGEHRRDLRLASRALDLGVYVVAAGLTGHCGEGRFSGGTSVHDPEGRALQLLDDEPGVLVVDLDPTAVARARADYPADEDPPGEGAARARVGVLPR